MSFHTRLSSSKITSVSCSNDAFDSALLDDDDVVAIATRTCLDDIKLNIHLAWYLASAAC